MKRKGFVVRLLLVAVVGLIGTGVVETVGVDEQPGKIIATNKIIARDTNNFFITPSLYLFCFNSGLRILDREIGTT